MAMERERQQNDRTLRRWLLLIHVAIDIPAKGRGGVSKMTELSSVAAAAATPRARVGPSSGPSPSDPAPASQTQTFKPLE